MKCGYTYSRDTKELSIGSRFIAFIQCKVYEKAIKDHARGLLLDLGCGKVPLYEIYRCYVTDNICIDWTNTSHTLHLDYKFDLNNEIPLESSIFDTILITDVLEHLHAPEILFREMSRLLRPNGKLILGVPFIYRIHDEPYDYYRFTEFSLRMFCKRNGMKIISLEPYGGATEIILDIVAKEIAFSKILSEIHLFLSKLCINFNVAMKLSNKTSRKFPLGYYLIAQK